jgi:hypothetical protein
MCFISQPAALLSLFQPFIILEVQNMRNIFLAVLPIATILLMGLPSSALAETFSKPGIALKLTFFNGMFGATPEGGISGTYQTASDIEGILFPARSARSETVIDTEHFNFVDTKGKERCYGLSTMSSGAVSTWEVKGAVPGYKCSTVGKTYRFNFGR